MTKLGHDIITQEVIKEVHDVAGKNYKDMNGTGKDSDFFLARVYANATLTALAHLGYKITLEKNKEKIVIEKDISQFKNGDVGEFKEYYAENKMSPYSKKKE